MFKKIWDFITHRPSTPSKELPPGRAERRRTGRLFKKLETYDRYIWGMPGNKTVAGVPFQRTTTGRRIYEEKS